MTSHITSLCSSIPSTSELVKMALILLQLFFQRFSNKLVYDFLQNDSVEEAVVRTDEVEQLVDSGRLY